MIHYLENRPRIRKFPGVAVLNLVREMGYEMDQLELEVSVHLSTEKHVVRITLINCLQALIR